MRSSHTITVESDEGDFVEVDVDVEVYEEDASSDRPAYSECLLISWKTKQYCEWITEQMVDDEVQSLFEDHKI